MTRDFAKKTRQPDKKSRAPQKSSRQPEGVRRRGDEPSKSKQLPGWIWLFTGTLLGAFIMFLAYLSGVTETEQVPLATAEPSPAKNDAPSVPKPRFDFYKLLRESEAEIKLPPAAAHKPDQSSSKEEFILQVGSFKKVEDADRMRAELILMNLDAQVETVTVRNGQIWHRVLVGPYYTSSTVAKARSTLVTHDINPLLLKRKRG